MNAPSAKNVLSKPIIGWALALVVISGTLYLFFGPVGILYGLGFMLFYALAEFITKLIKPNAEATNNPVYRKNVQQLIKRHQSQSESRSE
jgi:hypothetical protein